MTKKLKGTILKLCIIAVFIVFVLAIIFLPLTKSNDIVLADGLGESTLAFTVEAGSFVPGTHLSREYDDLPIFELNFSSLPDQRIIDAYGSELFLEYLESTIVVNDISSQGGSLLWTPLKTDGLAGEENFDLVSKKGYLSVEHLVDKFKANNPDAQEYRRMIYFRARQAKPGESGAFLYYYYTFPVWDVFVDLVPSSEAKKYEMVITPFGFTPSIVTFRKMLGEDGMGFSLEFKQESTQNNINSMNLSFAMLDYTLAQNPDQVVNWLSFSDYQKDDNPQSILLATSTEDSVNTSLFNNPTGLNIKYIYFRVTDTSSGSDPVVYRSPSWFEIKLDPITDPTDIEIANVSATYQGVRDYPLHISQESGLPIVWSQEPIKIEVATNGLGESVTIEARFESGKLANQGIFFTYNASTERYVANILQEAITVGSESIDMYSGKLKIIATAGEIQKQVDVYVHIDKTTPQIICEAESIDGTTQYNYNDPNAWSSQSLIFKVLDTEDSRPISGVTYDYLSENGWQKLTGDEAYKKVTINRTQDVYIRATTGAGKIGVLSTRARIDTKAPKLKVVAIDGKEANGKQVLSSNHELGGEPLGNRRIGYAQDKLTFELSNLTIQDQTANTIKYYWKKSNEPENRYRNITKDNNKYTFVLEDRVDGVYRPIVNLTINLKIVAMTGLSQVISFNTTILPSHYSVGMNLDFEGIEQVESRIGETVNNEIIKWYAQKLPIKFTATDNLTTLGAQQYKAYSFIKEAEADTTQELLLTKDPSQAGVPTGSIRLIGYIDRSVKNQELGFYLLDKADNKVDIDVNTNEKMFSPSLYLDIKSPQAKVERFIFGGSGTVARLEDSDWAKGAVQIQIELPSNLLPVSGAALFEIYPNGGESGTEIPGKETLASGFRYTIKKDERGIYRYMVRSGSGIGTELIVEVNIDNTDIVLNDMSAKTINPINGELIKDDIAIDGTEKVSSTVRVEFDTNHLGHFTYEYIDFSSSGDPNMPDLGPIHVTDKEYFDIIMPDIGAEGTKRFGFRLRSKAKDQNGEVSTTGTAFHIVTFQYDTRIYKITSTPSSDGVNWSTSPTRVDLAIDSSSGNIQIVKYQLRIDPSSAPAGTSASWIDIDAIPVTDGSYALSYLFPGLKWYVNNKERNDDTGLTELGTLYTDLSEQQQEFASYKGKLYFRAISDSGMPSEEVHVDIKQDTSTINALYALHQESGEIALESNSWFAYSKHNFKYWLPSKNDTSKAHIFENKAPVQYSIIAGGETQPDESSSEWSLVNNLNEAYVLDSAVRVFWIKATRGTTSKIDKLEVRKQAVSHPLTIDFVDAENGNLGNQSNLYIFEWVQRAGITVKVKSDSKVYYWYKIGDNPWEKYFDTAMAPGEEYTDLSRTIIFVGHSDYATDIERPHAKVVNIKNTVLIKVTNQAGDEAILSTSFYIKIDVDFPKLDSENVFVKTVSGKPVSLVDIGSTWYSEDLIIEISRNFDNASGIEYSYRMEGQSDYVPIGNNLLNTNHIVSFPKKGGEATIVLRAEQKAHGYLREYTISFRIDKVVPEFSLEGLAYKMIDGSPQQLSGKLDSGQWINADEVRLLIRQRADAIAISPTRYYRYARDDLTWREITDITSYLTIHSLEEVRISCRTEAGREVIETFQANIDQTAPIINAGKFQNPTTPENPTDPLVYNEYYIDQKITYIEDNLATAEYNGYPLPYGHVIATNTIDNTVQYVHIIVVDKAGNKAELKFKMRPFPLTAAGDESAITLSDEHLNMLIEYENQYEEAKLFGMLTESRDKYFEAQIARLKDRVATMRKQIADFQAFLQDFDIRATFELHLDFLKMKSFWDKFYSGDPLIEYPQWQQERIVLGYTSQFEKFKMEYNKLLAKRVVVIRIQKSIAALPARNVVEASDYANVIAVYAKYIELASDQKAVFDSDLKNKITELKRICEVFLLQDNETGVKIYGDTLIAENPGKQLEVEIIGKDAEIYISTQEYLMQTQSSDKARSVVSVNTLSLSGTGSSYELGTFDVTLTIPQEYRQYKLFAVYRRSPDGTLSAIENVQRTPDGKQVVFASQELGTYVLASASNIQPRGESGKIYGTIGGIEINAEILTYITFAVIGIFVVFVVVLVLVVIRRKRFLAKYNKAHKGSLIKRGIENIPKGNTAPASNPARPEERIPTEKIVRYKVRKSKNKKK